MNNSKKKNRVNRFLIVVLVLVALGALAVALEKLGVTNFYEKKSKGSNLVSTGDINYGPPTEEEKQAGDQQKDKVISDEKIRINEEGQNTQAAHVIITDAGQYDDIIEVRAFIPDHYQDGTCSITFTKDSRTVKKDTSAYRDASTTICTNPLIKRSEFPVAGNWQLVVHYTSAGASGSSDIKTVSIN